MCCGLCLFCLALVMYESHYLKCNTTPRPKLKYSSLIIPIPITHILLFSPHPLSSLFLALHLFSFSSICFFSVFSVPLPLLALWPRCPLSLSVSQDSFSLSSILQIPSGFLRNRPFWQTVTPPISLSLSLSDPIQFQVSIPYWHEEKTSVDQSSF